MDRVTFCCGTKKSFPPLFTKPNSTGFPLSLLFSFSECYIFYLHKNSCRYFIYICIHSLWRRERKWGNPKPKSTFLQKLKTIPVAVSVPKSNSNLAFICLDCWILLFITWVGVQSVFSVFPSVKSDAMWFCSVETRRNKGCPLKKGSDLGDAVPLLQCIIKERKNYVEPHMSDHNSSIYEFLRCDCWKSF